jgi:hypothetical protein
VKIFCISLGLMLSPVFACGCGASTPQPATAHPQALMVPAWVEPSGPSSGWTGQAEAMPQGPRSVVVPTNPNVQYSTGVLPTSGSRPQPGGGFGTTFFPREYDSKMFGGCGASGFTDGRCPDRKHDNP